MKKFSLFLLVAAFVIVSIPFSVHAEEVSPYALVCRCPPASRVTACLSLGDNTHGICCLSCGYVFSSEPHDMVYGESCGDPVERCDVCSYESDEIIEHAESELEIFGDDGHGTHCLNPGCQHNPASSNYTGMLFYEEHEPHDPMSITGSGYEAGDYVHYITWNCYLCDYVYVGFVDCGYQNEDCTGGCFAPTN